MSYVYFRDVDAMINSEFDHRKAINWNVINRHNPLSQSPGVNHHYLLGLRKDQKWEIVPILYSAGRAYINIDLRQHDLDAMFDTLQYVCPHCIVQVLHKIDTTPEGHKVEQQEYTNSHCIQINENTPMVYMFISGDSWMSDLMSVLAEHQRGKHISVTIHKDHLDPGGAVMMNLESQGFMGYRSCIFKDFF